MDDTPLLRLSGRIAEAVGSVFEVLPLERAMTQLVVSQMDESLVAVVEKVLGESVIGENAGLAAGLWLYVDQLDRSHAISQGMAGATGSYWHGIMHRREGDFSNSHYWFRKVGEHEAMAGMGGEYDGHGMIDEVEAAHRAGRADERLIAMQQREWAGLFAWCARGE